MILDNPFHIVLIAVPLTVQTVLIFAVAYRWMRAWHDPPRSRRPRRTDRCQQLLRARRRRRDRPVRPAVRRGARPPWSASSSRSPLMLALVRYANRTRTQVPDHLVGRATSGDVSDVVVRRCHTYRVGADASSPVGRSGPIKSAPWLLGGTASVPVAEPGAPEDLDGAERFELAGIEIYVDRRLSGVRRFLDDRCRGVWSVASSWCWASTSRRDERRSGVVTIRRRPCSARGPSTIVGGR